MTGEEFRAIADVIYANTGISLDRTKEYLIETRLNQLLAQNGFKNYREFAGFLSFNHNSKLMVDLVDAITTNETYFFRDKTPFDLLRSKLLLEIAENASNRNFEECRPDAPLRIWSAACSTGQEAYSIAITICETFKNAKMPRVEILGTDISKTALDKAKSGAYTEMEISRGLSKEMLGEYFYEEFGRWYLKPQIKSMVSFKPHNLMQPFESLGKWDLVFCRNVAIYFSMEDKQKLFGNIAKSLRSHGALILGASEFVVGVSDKLTANHFLGSVYYTPKGEE